jgi:hypothetical protein
MLFPLSFATCILIWQQLCPLTSRCRGCSFPRDGLLPMRLGQGWTAQQQRRQTTRSRTSACRYLLAVLATAENARTVPLLPQPQLLPSAAPKLRRTTRLLLQQPGHTRVPPQPQQ